MISILTCKDTIEISFTWSDLSVPCSSLSRASEETFEDLNKEKTLVLYFFVVKT